MEVLLCIFHKENKLCNKAFIFSEAQLFSFFFLTTNTIDKVNPSSSFEVGLCEPRPYFVQKCKTVCAKSME